MFGKSITEIRIETVKTLIKYTRQVFV